MVLFAQESGRAGRDGERAYSLILLPSSWEASEGGNTSSRTSNLPATHDISLGKQRERQAMHKYLESDQCFRTSLSEYLDYPEQRRWCMPEDVLCDICQQSHEEPIRPSGKDSEVEGAMESTGNEVIERARQREHLELARYREDLIAVRGSCALCRVMEDQWDHDFRTCQRRIGVFQESKRARRRGESKGGQWLQPYSACFWCLNPQSICQRASGGVREQGERCEEADVVLPLCFGVFRRSTGAGWLSERFGRGFQDMESYFDWLGEESEFGGGKAIQAVRVAAEVLVNFHLY